MCIYDKSPGFVASFIMVHQSGSDVCLHVGERALPLYCVASTHTMLHTYKWECSGVALSGSSPVMWVTNLVYTSEL